MSAPQKHLAEPANSDTFHTLIFKWMEEGKKGRGEKGKRVEEGEKGCEERERGWDKLTTTTPTSSSVTDPRQVTYSCTSVFIPARRGVTSATSASLKKNY